MEAHLVDSSDEESDEGLQDRPEEASASEPEDDLFSELEKLCGQDHV